MLNNSIIGYAKLLRSMFAASIKSYIECVIHKGYTNIILRSLGIFVSFHFRTTHYLKIDSY